MQHQRSRCGSVSGRALLRQRAFTLIELLVVIAIIASLTFIAVPAFKGFGQANTLAAAQRQIQDDLALARQLAIKNRTPVYLVFFAPDPPDSGVVDPLGRSSSVALASVLNNLNGLAPSDFKSKALRVFTNVIAGQYASYAFYAEGRVGDQPVFSKTGDDGALDVRRGRYLTVGGSIWRTLPDGIIFAPGLRFRLALSTSTNLPVKAVPFPLAPEGGDPSKSLRPADFQLYLPVIAYDALGRSMRVDDKGQIDVNATPRDQFVSLGIGSVFVPHQAGATNNYDFNRPADVVETPKENYTNTIFRVTGLTGRARKFVWGTQP